jgi:hypothetical protein
MRRAAAVAVLCMGFGGCGAEDAARDAAERVDPVAEAAEKTVAAGGARLSGDMEMTFRASRARSRSRSTAPCRSRTTAGASPWTEANPQEMLRFLQASGGARREGPDTIGGVPTTRWHADVRLSDYPRTVAPEEREEASSGEHGEEVRLDARIDLLDIGKSGKVELPDDDAVEDVTDAVAEEVGK